MQRVQGSHVVLAARNMSKCEETKRELEDYAHLSSCSCYSLDLSDFSSVRKFAAAIGDDLHKRKCHLKLLVNNAGVLTTAQGPSGEDLTFSTNHLGPFLLTRLLTPHMQPGSRIVNVSSRAHYRGSLSFQPDGSLSEVHRSWANFFSLGFVTYARSKLSNVLFTAELNRRLRDKGITSIATSPGPVNTSLFRDLPSPLSTLLKPAVQRLFRSPEEGASSSLFAALSPDLDLPPTESALFIHDDKACEPSKMSKDSELAKKLWQYSERLTDLEG